MFKTKRKLELEKVKVKNRDEFIEKMCIKEVELREEIQELKSVLKDIQQLTECNTYNNEKANLGKIKEICKSVNKGERF